MTRQKSSIPADSLKATNELSVKNEPQKSSSHNIISTAILFIGVPLATLLLVSYVFQAFQVSGESMERTLQNGDRVLIWKVPRSFARLTKHDFIPARGDVIVFNSPTLHQVDGSDKHLIKRVIGLPGERVVIKDGKITVFNQLHPNGFNPDVSINIIAPTQGKIDIIVAAGHVFVCGDNRNNSIDSRSFGAVNSRDIIGNAAFRMLPLNKIDLSL